MRLQLSAKRAEQNDSSAARTFEHVSRGTRSMSMSMSMTPTLELNEYDCCQCQCRHRSCHEALRKTNDKLKYSDDLCKKYKTNMVQYCKRMV